MSSHRIVWASYSSKGLMGFYGGSLARDEAKVLAETHVDAAVQIGQA